jgi:Rha family phage regulatory protein
MNDLVFIENGQAVTDSLTVAEVFGKRHDLVMRDIRNLECSIEFNLLNFAEIDYTDDRNRTYKRFLIKRDGLAFLVMGYTGTKAAQYKEKYIAAFSRMEEQLKQPRILSEKEQLVASMKLSIETSGEVGMLKGEVQDLKEKVNSKITLDHGEQQTLHHEIKKRVERLAEFGGYDEKQKRSMYSQIHSHLRRAFSAPSYRVVKQRDYEEAKAWVKSWRPLI